MRLQTGADYTQRIPLDVCGGIMSRISPLFVGSLRMAMEGASIASGRPPAWLERASDIRFLDYSHDGDDTLIVTGLECREVGIIAANGGVTLYELSRQEASLEEAFMELTRDSVEFHGHADPTRTPAAVGREA